MEQHSQVAKALRLRQLRTRLCALGLEGAKSDMDATLLQLLFTLANRPLDTEVPEVSAALAGGSTYTHTSPQRTPQAQRARRALVDRDNEADEDEDGEEDDDWDSSSELSDWGEEESEAEGAATAAGPVSEAPDGIEAVHDEPTAAGSAAAAIDDPAAGPAAAAKAADAMVQALTCSRTTSLMYHATPLIPPRATPAPSDLMPSLYSARLGLLARMVAPPPDKCLSDVYVVHQVLNVLLGRGSTCFVWQPVAQPAGTSLSPGTHTAVKPGSFPDKQLVPAPGVHVPYLSPGLLASLLAEFGEAGSQVAWLQHHITASTQQVRVLHVAGVSDHLRLTSCVRALLQAGAAQLHVLAQPLIQLQQLNQDAAAGSKDQSTVSLLQLRQLCTAPMRRMQALVGAVWAALSAQAAADSAAMTATGTEAPAAHLSATLLDSLFGQLQAAALYSGPEGKEGSSALLHLLLCAMAPLLDSMHAWLYNSREDSFTGGPVTSCLMVLLPLP